MRIGIFGGTGFVGSHIIDALLAAGHTPVVLVRPGHEARLRQAEVCVPISGDVADASAVDRLVGESEALIYNIGLLREFPERGITFEALHYEAPLRIMQAAQRQGPRRFVLMSANGVRADGTAYQATKYRAEQALWQADLDGTVLRPSVIFGDPRGRMEFASQLAQDVIASPLPAPLFYPGLLPTGAGAFELSPVHVLDVAAAFVRVLERPEAIGQTLCLGGPRALSWREILETLAAVLGRRKLMLPVPALGVSAAAGLLDRFESFPITRDQIRMLLEGNRCAPDDLRGLGIEPQAFDAAHLRYLTQTAEGGSSWQHNAA